MWLTCRDQYRPCPLWQQEFFVSSAKLKTHSRLCRLLCRGRRHQFCAPATVMFIRARAITSFSWGISINQPKILENVRVTTAAHLRNSLSEVYKLHLTALFIVSKLPSQ